MALADTGRAIGAVTRLLQGRLVDALSVLPAPGVAIVRVSVGRPEPAGATGQGRRLNLFLYEIRVDGQLRNTSIRDGDAPPLWLSLHYLLTPFDRDGESDTIEAQEILGEAAVVLQGLNFVGLDGAPGASIRPLSDNPEPLKVSFDDASSELLGRVMQGSDERYRCSLAFAIRPVLVAAPEPPSYALLVGVDSRTPEVIGRRGVHVPVLPSLGPRIATVGPAAIEPADGPPWPRLEVGGDDLHLEDLVVRLGDIAAGAVGQRPDWLVAEFTADQVNGGTISAGSHPVVVAQRLPGGRSRRSNVLAASILPRLDAASTSAVSRVYAWVPTSPVRARVVLRGRLLGTADDDVSVALYRDGDVVRVVDEFERPAAGDPQAQLAFELNDRTAVPPGDYNIILRVNGEQARNAPRIRMIAP